MRVPFERVTQIRMSMATVLVAVTLSACGGGKNSSDDDTEASMQVSPDSIFVRWTAPTTNADGSPIKDLAGYRVYYGTASGFYTDSVTINNPGTLSTTISNLPADTYYVVVRAFNSMNVESQASVELSKTTQ